MIKRKKTRKIKVRDRFIGGDSPILVQSMTNVPTKDLEKVISQVKQLEKAGCELVRLGIPDMESAKALGTIVKSTYLPVAADIHFDANLAREAIKQGVHKLRINPGNLLNEQDIEDIAKRAKKACIPIRIGVNAGSLNKRFLKKHNNHVCSDAMVESALWEVELLEKFGFKDIIISLKASSVRLCVEANEKISQKVDYPLHIGITEAGLREYGTIKSSVGLGILLYKGIGDTLRVSLTSDPVNEVTAGWDILKALQLRQRGVEIISCPTCARREIDVEYVAQKVREETRDIVHPVKIAVMGCSVNGPGEAKEADIGIAGGKGKAVIFREGKTHKKNIREDEMLEMFLNEINIFIIERIKNESIQNVDPDFKGRSPGS